MQSAEEKGLVRNAPMFVEPEIDPRALLNMMSRRRWTFFGVLALIFLAGTLVTIHAPRIYRATATVMIEAHPPDVLGGVREVYDLGNMASSHDYYQTQYAIIRSVPVAERVVAMLGLATQGLLEQLKQAGPSPLEARAAGDGTYGLPPGLQSKLSLLGLNKLGSRESIVARLATFDAVSFVQRRTKVLPVQDSHLVKISIEDEDPERAAQFADAIADAYIELNLEQKIDFTRSAVDWLSDQMHDLKDSLESSELALYEFKRENNVVSVSMEDRQSMTSQMLSQLNQSLATGYAQRLALESRRVELRRVRQAQLDANAGELEDTQIQLINSPVIERLNATFMEMHQQKAELATRYTAQHPRLMALNEKMQVVRDDIVHEIDKVIGSVEQEYNTSIGTERRLKQAIEQIQTEAMQLNKKEIDYSRLKRERDNNQALYELVLKRQKEADLSQMLKVNNARRLESARVPTAPIRPNVQMNLAASLLIGLLAGVAAAFLVDFLDSSIKSQEQLEKTIGLSFLGLLPAMKPDRGAKPLSSQERDQYAILHPRSSTAECCRNIRTNLLFMSADRPAKCIVLTSSEPREGKTTTVVNLALSMSQSGIRVVIVDTDMRRPRLHKSFGLVNDKGISNIIMGQMELGQATRNLRENLDLLGCGPIPPNPSELLHTQAFRALVEQLRDAYDLVIFDSPPVSAVTDTPILASILDGVVVVVHAGRTTWQAVRHARRRLEDVNARIFGVVLNQVDLDDKRSGGYQYYYQYYNYHSEEEPPRAPARA